MPIDIWPIHSDFAAEIGGIESGKAVDRAAVDTIWEAIDRYGVLAFHDQHLHDYALRCFARKFGKLEIGRAAAEATKRRLALPEIGDISNLDEEGRLRGRDDRRRLGGTAVLEYRPTEMMPPVGTISKHPRVSAGPGHQASRAHPRGKPGFSTFESA